MDQTAREKYVEIHVRCIEREETNILVNSNKQE